jgi:flavodoxin I
MSDVTLFFGSSTGNTESSAELIAEELTNEYGKNVNLVNVSDISASDLLVESDKIIIGISTWEIGELQPDWDYIFEDIKDMDFSGKKIAVFGHGDAFGYPDTYQDAVGIMAEKFKELGAEIVGKTSTEGYDFDASKAQEGDQFVGLALDNDNEEDLTEDRVKNWVKQLSDEF